MTIPASLVKELREKTGAPLMECKQALKEAEGGIERAIKILRTRGLASARAKAERETKEGAIFSYLHPDKKLGVLLELNCESDFVARTPEFQELGKNLCLQIAAMNPVYLSKEDIPEERLKEEESLFREQAKKTGKPESIIDKIVEGRLKAYFREVCLLQQPYIKEESVNVSEYILSVAAKLKENIRLARFVRYRLGER